jgi:hypothetical protein
MASVQRRGPFSPITDGRRTFSAWAEPANETVQAICTDYFSDRHIWEEWGL